MPLDVVKLAMFGEIDTFGGSCYGGRCRLGCAHSAGGLSRRVGLTMVLVPSFPAHREARDRNVILVDDKHETVLSIAGRVLPWFWLVSSLLVADGFAVLCLLMIALVSSSIRIKLCERAMVSWSDVEG